MARKKWTPIEQATKLDLRIRDKKKWQLALRRYVLQKQVSTNYAAYFGIDIISFRVWIELQFTGNLNWDNFGTKWQFSHVVPLAYFNFEIEDDLKLCWNFVNIRVEKLNINEKEEKNSNAIALKTYFQKLYNNTNYFYCTKILAKLEDIEKAYKLNEPTLENFLTTRTNDLEIMYNLSAEDFLQINTGVSIKDVLLEKEILRKFG